MTNPSEALECVDKILGYFGDDNVQIETMTLSKCNVLKIKQALLKAQEHKSLDLLMQELDCKDFADLRKYARCGYEKLNKKYLKWEDLEFKESEQTMKVLLNGNLYFIRFGLLFEKTQQVELYSKNEEHLMNFNSYYKEDIQLFNDLHLERVEE